MYIDYVGTINRIYNRCDDPVYGYKYKHILNAVEAFNKYFIDSGRHPIHMKVELRDKSTRELVLIGKEMFGLYYASLFTLYLDEV